MCLDIGIRRMGFRIGCVRSRVARMGRRACAGITCMGLDIAAYGAWRCISGRIDIVVPTVELLCLDEIPLSEACETLSACSATPLLTPEHHSGTHREHEAQHDDDDDGYDGNPHHVAARLAGLLFGVCNRLPDEMLVFASTRALGSFFRLVIPCCSSLRLRHLLLFLGHVVP